MWHNTEGYLLTYMPFNYQLWISQQIWLLSLYVLHKYSKFLNVVLLLSTYIPYLDHYYTVEQAHPFLVSFMRS